MERRTFRAFSPIGAAFATSALLVSLMAPPPSAFAAGSKARGPSSEDGASYFAEDRHSISAADLAKADDLRHTTMASIEQLLSVKKNTDRRFELLLRLGELHVERHDYLRDGEMGLYDREWDAWNKDRKGKEPRLNTTASDDEMTKAANAFRRLVSEFPKHPRTDAALFSLARVLSRMGKETSVDYYKQLIRGFPKSPLVPDTYLSLGEFYFDRHKIPEATTYYKKVLDFKEHRAYPYAVYKLGWAYYDSDGRNAQENYKKATSAFKLVIALADKDKEQNKPRGNLDLRDEAIKDLIMVWAETEDVDAAWAYFRSIGEDKSFYTMLDHLGAIYADQGKNQQAIDVYKRLLKEAPSRAGNAAIDAKLVELYDLTNNIPAVVAELKTMDSLYTDPEGMRIAELTTHRYGAMFHQRGQKAKSKEYLHSAADVYTLYLGAFASHPNAYEIRYYLAEILFDFHQYEAASQHYMIVAKADPKGKYLRPAALNSVAAMNQLVQSSSWPALPPAGQVPLPLAIPHAKAKLVEVIDDYVALLPREKDGEPMRFTAAQTLFDYGHYPEAVARFDKLTQAIPASKQAKVATRVILGYYADKEDWTKVISWTQHFAKAEVVQDAQLKKYVLDLMRGAMFKQALAFEKGGKYDLAANSFLGFQKAFPADANADRAVYNAMLNFYKLESIEPALAAANLLLVTYPHSAALPDALATIGSTNEALAKFDEAAAAYRLLAMNYPQDKRSPMALYNAAILYKGLNNFDEATRLLGEFSRRYPTNDLAAEATMEYAKLLEAHDHSAEAIKAYQAYGKRYGDKDPNQRFFAAAKASTLKVAAGDHSGQKEVDQLRLALGAKTAPPAPEARAVLAALLFKQTEPSFTTFQNMAITDGNQIEAQVAAKQAVLERLATSYTQIVDLAAGEYTVASLYRMGEAHENFANVLFKAPPPKGASQVDTDKLKTELEKVAFPLRDQAYKYFESAYKRSREVETFTVWTRRTYQKMAELAPEKHPDVNELSAEPTYLAHDVKMSAPVADLVGEESP